MNVQEVFKILQAAKLMQEPLTNYTMSESFYF